MSEGEMQHKVGPASTVMCMLDRTILVKIEPEGKALNLHAYILCYISSEVFLLHISSITYGCITRLEAHLVDQVNSYVTKQVIILEIMPKTAC